MRLNANITDIIYNVLSNALFISCTQSSVLYLDSSLDKFITYLMRETAAARNR